MKNVTQEQMKHARTQDWYDTIWKTVGKCVFCDLKDQYIIYEEQGVVLTVNLFPYIDGQLMAIPRRHVSSPKELTQLEWDTLRKLSYVAKKLIKKVHGHKGMWTLIREGKENAQMTVTDHLHMQLIPFDAPDLAVWNFRELNYTPLENAKLYRNAWKDLEKALAKFETKYTSKSETPVVCDAIIINPKKEVLFQERTEETKFDPDVLTLPGGHVDDFTATLEEELTRECAEEVGKILNPLKLKLKASRMSSLIFNDGGFLNGHQKKLRKRFLWNTYVYDDIVDPRDLHPGDDCRDLVWLSLAKIKKSTRIDKTLQKLLVEILHVA